jgi:hypothetical protein
MPPQGNQIHFAAESIERRDGGDEYASKLYHLLKGSRYLDECVGRLKLATPSHWWPPGGGKAGQMWKKTRRQSNTLLVIRREPQATEGPAVVRLELPVARCARDDERTLHGLALETDNDQEESAKRGSAGTRKSETTWIDECGFG